MKDVANLESVAPAAHGGQENINSAKAKEDHNYAVIVILDGEERLMHYPIGITVQEAMVRRLPATDKPKVGEFDMVDGNVGTEPLDPNATLLVAGVRDDHVLSITKKHGGGG